METVHYIKGTDRDPDDLVSEMGTADYRSFQKTGTDTGDFLSVRGCEDGDFHGRKSDGDRNCASEHFQRQQGALRISDQGEGVPLGNFRGIR